MKAAITLLNDEIAHCQLSLDTWNERRKKNLKPDSETSRWIRHYKKKIKELKAALQVLENYDSYNQRFVKLM